WPVTYAFTGEDTWVLTVRSICGWTLSAASFSERSTAVTMVATPGCGRSSLEPGVLSQGERMRASGRARSALTSAGPCRSSWAAGPFSMIGTSTLLPKRLVAMSCAREDSVPFTTRIEGENLSLIRLPTKPSAATSASQITRVVRGRRMTMFAMCAIAAASLCRAPGSSDLCARRGPWKPRDRAAGPRAVDLLASVRSRRDEREHALGQVEQAIRVAPLVVVPGHDLHARGIHDAREAGVEDRRVGRLDDVRRDERLVAVRQDAGQRAAVRQVAEDLVDLLAGRGTFGLDRQV